MGVPPRRSRVVHVDMGVLPICQTNKTILIAYVLRGTGDDVVFASCFYLLQNNLKINNNKISIMLYKNIIY